MERTCGEVGWQRMDISVGETQRPRERPRVVGMRGRKSTQQVRAPAWRQNWRPELSSFGFHILLLLWSFCHSECESNKDFYKKIAPMYKYSCFICCSADNRRGKQTVFELLRESVSFLKNWQRCFWICVLIILVFELASFSSMVLPPVFYAK